MEEKNIADVAADKLQAECEECVKAYSGAGAAERIKKALAPAVSKMLTKFCYQNEEFAAEVAKCERPLKNVIDKIGKSVKPDNPALSDIDAYKQAVEFYLPNGRVTASFRITVPSEIDEDLFDLAEDGGEKAIILDLFSTEDN